jgi:hypothetical protein
MFTIRLTKSFVLVLILIFAIDSYGQKMSPQEIVAKHLDSIGTKEDRAWIKNQVVVGDVQIKIKGSPRGIAGKALILSAGEKNMWGMNLVSNEYPQDRFAYNGKETVVGFARPGAYSDIGRFILSYRELLREGLMGGTLSSSWALFSTETKAPKLFYEGTKKIDGKETLAISYAPKGGSDLNIKMYFDKETYSHVRTEYTRVVAAKMGTSVDTSAGQGESRFRLVEDFSNFQKAGNLMLPAAYKLSYSFYNSSGLQSAQTPNRELELRFDLVSFSYNDALDANAFNIEAN